MRLQHVSVAIAADGADEARAFYGDLLGLEEKPVPPKLDPEQLVWFHLGGDLELHLMQTGDAPPPRAHFCIAVDDRARRPARAASTPRGSRRARRPRSSAARASCATTRSGTWSS